MSYSKVSVLVPTRQRIAHLKRLLKSYNETISSPQNSEFVFRVDSDDIESAEFLTPLGWPVIIGPRNEGYKSLPGFYNEMVRKATGDIFVCGNDDMIFRTPDWPRLIIEEANKYPDGIFNIGVNTGLNDENYPFSIVSRRLVDQLGKINDERLLFSDIYLLDVARHFDRAVRLRTVEFFHDWTGHTDDATRRDGSRHEYNDVWETTPGTWKDEYTRRHKEVVGEAVAKLLALPDVKAARLIDEFKAYRPAAGVTGVWPPRIQPKGWAASDPTQGIRYGRDETLALLTTVLGSGIGRAQAVVTDLGNGLPSLLWGSAFDRITTLSGHTDPSAIDHGHHRIVGGPRNDATMLSRVVQSTGRVDCLVLDGDRYSDIIACYFAFRPAMARPGMVVFASARSRRGQPPGMPHVIAELRSGELDGTRHDIVDVVPSDGAGFCYEMMT